MNPICGPLLFILLGFPDLSYECPFMHSLQKQLTGNPITLIARCLYHHLSFRHRPRTGYPGRASTPLQPTNRHILIQSFVCNIILFTHPWDHPFIFFPFPLCSFFSWVPCLLLFSRSYRRPLFMLAFCSCCYSSTSVLLSPQSCILSPSFPLFSFTGTHRPEIAKVPVHVAYTHNLSSR